MTSKKNSEFEYVGQDLEAMMQAENYYRWIYSIIKPYVGKYVIEVGAGVGSFTRLILESSPRELTLFEPSARMYGLLTGNIKNNRTTKVAMINNYLSSSSKKLIKSKVDTAIYINVFEHIEDDLSEIKRVSQILESGGHVVIFVPALQSLYSNFDKSIDHYRRYDKKSLRKLCESADLEIVKLKYIDMVGILPWWVSFVLMKRTTLIPALVKIYDKLCVPLIRLVENYFPAPLGKNILVVAKKK